MLGTFSFEPYFKSYPYFIVGSLEFLEIVFRSFIPFLQPACSVFPAAAVQHRRRRRGEPARPPLASRWRPRVAPELLHRPLLRAGAPLPCHAPRRAQSRPRGRHLAAAVASSLQRPPPSPSARTSTTKTPAPHPFVLSLAPHSDAPEHTAAPPATPASPVPPSTRHCSHPPPTLTP